MSLTNNTSEHLFMPQSLAVLSARDNGYKNTAYALAELIDNSYQAIERLQAEDPTYTGHIEVLLVEERSRVDRRERMVVTKIAVVDNGCGMSPSELRNALQFGNGSHLNDRSGIGRFGVGLPHSTISQCRRADVWTWQTGYKNATTSYLDLLQIETDELQEVPVPTQSMIPDEWLRNAPMIKDSESGTLVVWTDLDRVKWRTAKSTMENTEALIGRIYRKLLAKGLVLKIVVVSEGKIKPSEVRPNDPLYLMAPTSTPEPFSEVPMFRPYGKDGRQIFPVLFQGETHEIVVTLSYATDEARLLPDGGDAGGEPYGKHARENIGVSVVRADRELILDTTWSNHDLRERWWGAEISFPPALDEVFGVTNNKQYATHFTEMHSYFRDDRNGQRVAGCTPRGGGRWRSSVSSNWDMQLAGQAIKIFKRCTETTDCRT